MSALAKIKQAGFAVAVSELGGLLIDPSSRLTATQRSFIAANKAELIAELQKADSSIGVPATGNVCCAECRHSDMTVNLLRKRQGYKQFCL